MDMTSFEKLIGTNAKIAMHIRDENEIYKGNRIFVIDDNGSMIKTNGFPNVAFQHKGKNSLVVIHKSANISSAHFVIGEGGYIYIDKSFRVRQKLYADLGNENNTLYFGKNSNVGDVTIYAGDEPDLEVIIGSNFLSAYNLKLRAADGHTIFDADTGEVLNAANFGIHIAGHVWCGMNVTVIKDVTIPNDCVVGACALVCKRHFNSHTIISGVPAKEIKSNISWSSVPIKNYIEQYKK